MKKKTIIIILFIAILFLLIFDFGITLYMYNTVKSAEPTSVKHTFVYIYNDSNKIEEIYSNPDEADVELNL